MKNEKRGKGEKGKGEKGESENQESRDRELERTINSVVPSP